MTDHNNKKDKFVRVVSFDTMTDTDLPNYSFTLRGKSTDYKKTRRSRTFMVATDLANYSEYALRWATDEIMDDGDELIVLRVVTVDMNGKRKSGNIAGLLETEAKQSRENANQVMENIMSGAGVEKKISVILEFVIGKVQETIQSMIAMYQPSLLIVGTRGLSEFKGMLLGSVSKYCLQHSPVPVAVVRPEGKHKKTYSGSSSAPAVSAISDKKKKKLSGIMRIGSVQTNLN
ncbi:adenine nucleotide alpha hydrolases-like protein [Backusella circina FSU 941]|nr:adenine nucleotide alpha hydrolases-like protein [Backusella circina FSU 941]